MMCGVRVLFGLLVLLSVAGEHARADVSSSPALSWLRDDGAESCISVQELATRVEQRLSRVVFTSPSSATLHIEGRIAPRSGGRFRVHLTASDASGKVLGTRTLDAASSDCRAFDESLVLVIALAVDSSGGFVALPEGLTEAGDPAASLLAELQSAPPTQVAAPVASSAPPLVQPKPEAEDPRDHFHVRLGIAALGELGLVPDTGLGLALEPQLIVPGDWMISVRGAALLPNTEAIDGGGEVAIGAWLAGLGTCTPQLSLALGGVRGCAGARLGMLTIDARGLEQPRDRQRLLLDPWLEGEVSWPIGRSVWLRMQAGLHVPLIRDTIQVLDANRQPVEAYRVAALTFQLGLGLVIAIAE